MARNPTPIPPVREVDLYAPIKAYLVRQGYGVKGEVGAADVVAVRGDEDPLIVELKLGFSLSLFHQGITRLSVTDFVYIAVPHKTGKPFQRALKDNIKLARRVGLGVMTVRPRDGHVEVHADPAPYVPRKSQNVRGFWRCMAPLPGPRSKHGQRSRRPPPSCATTITGGSTRSVAVFMSLAMRAAKALLITEIWRLR